MAAVFNLSYGMQGDLGHKYRHNVFIPRGALSLAQVQGFSDDYVALLDAASECLIIDAQVVVEMVLPVGLKGAAVAKSDGGIGGRLSFSVNGTSYSQGMYIPGILDSLKIPEKALNTTGPNSLSALITAVESGIDVGGTVISPSDEQGSDLIALVGSGQSKRK